MGAKDNNKGFSLLELLVAVAILAVIVTPFLMAFLTTTRINASTKDQQRAKFAATNVMEDIRSRNVDDVLAECVAGEEEGTYLYTTTQESDGIEYTVEAILDPRYSDESKLDEATDYNAEMMAHIYGMNSAYDSFYELDATTDNSKIEQLAEIMLGNRDEEKLREIYSSVNREIILTIADNSKGGTDVKVRSVYSMPSGATINKVETQDQIIYSDSTGDIDLRNVYLFYDPLYNGTKKQARETITVVNEKGITCSVYLVRQDWPVDQTSDKYKNFPFFKYCEYPDNGSRNDNYIVNVRLKEPTRSDSSITGDDGEVKVLTTIKTNIDELQDAKKVDAYMKESSDKVLNAHLKLTYSNSGDNYAFTKTVDGNTYTAARIMGLSNLAGEIVSDHVYKVTVKAYKGVGDDKEENASSTITATTQ